MIYNNFAVFTYESNIFHINGRFLGKRAGLSIFFSVGHLLEQHTTFKRNIYYFKPYFTKTIIIIFLLQLLRCLKISTK